MIFVEGTQILPQFTLAIDDECMLLFLSAFCLHVVCLSQVLDKVLGEVDGVF